MNASASTNARSEIGIHDGPEPAAPHGELGVGGCQENVAPAIKRAAEAEDDSTI